METKIIIQHEVYTKIMHWVDKAVGEVSGLGKIQVAENGDLIVTSAILVEQQNTAASTDLDPGAVAKAMFELKDTPGELRFWWHSHVNMAVFWSGTDTATMQTLGAHGWFLSTVFNKKREMRSAIFQQKPFRLFVDNLNTQIEVISPAYDVNTWDSEFQEKCKSLAPTYKNTGYPSMGYYGYDYTDYDGMDEQTWRANWKDTPKAKGFPSLTKKQRKSLKRKNKNIIVTERAPLANDSILNLEAMQPADLPNEFDENSGMITTNNNEIIHHVLYEDMFGVDVLDPEVQSYLGMKEEQDENTILS
jgi:hypothetical protein